MKRFLVLFFLFLISIGNAQESCVPKNGYTRCDIDLESQALNGQKAPVFTYRSFKLDPSKPVEFVLFLHGRGSSRESGANDSMLEHVGVTEINGKVGDQIIFVAPQDVFLHPDSNSVGQDYWIGRDDRNWNEFFQNTLVEYVDRFALNLKLKQFRFRTVVGISMGAHGALMLGHNFPDQFSQVSALSPIFRPVPTEMPTNDFDVFLDASLKVVPELNMGALLLSDRYQFSDQTYISISHTDFGLDDQNFPVAKTIWAKLQNRHQSNVMVEISGHSGGHSMSFWKEKLPESLNYLFNQ